MPTTGSPSLAGAKLTFTFASTPSRTRTLKLLLLSCGPGRMLCGGRYPCKIRSNAVCRSSRTLHSSPPASATLSCFGVSSSVATCTVSVPCPVNVTFGVAVPASVSATPVFTPLPVFSASVRSPGVTRLPSPPTSSGTVTISPATKFRGSDTVNSIGEPSLTSPVPTRASDTRITAPSYTFRLKEVIATATPPATLVPACTRAFSCMIICSRLSLTPSAVIVITTVAVRAPAPAKRSRLPVSVTPRFSPDPVFSAIDQSPPVTFRPSTSSGASTTSPATSARPRLTAISSVSPSFISSILALGSVRTMSMPVASLSTRLTSTWDGDPAFTCNAGNAPKPIRSVSSGSSSLSSVTVSVVVPDVAPAAIAMLAAPL